ncbi:unnamed protein product, partial [Brenthis ino]
MPLRVAPKRIIRRFTVKRGRSSKTPLADWRCVNKDRTLHYSPEKCAKIIIACCVLHNIALKFGVPDPEENDPTIEEDPVSQPTESIAGNTSSSGDLIRGRALRRLLVDRLNLM